MSSRPVRVSTSAGCAVVVCTLALDAHAEDLDAWAGTFVNPGAVWLLADGPVAASGPGFELSAGYTWLLRGDGVEKFFMPHVGGVFRVQEITEDDDAPGLGYLVAGVEGGASVLGVELTYVRRGQAADDRPLVLPRQEGLGVSPYLSLGVFTIGPQWIFPVSGKGGDPELGLNVGIKLPVVQIVYGLAALSGLWDRMPAGRPLRVAGQAARPAVLGPVDGAPTGLEAAVFEEHWTESAALEHAAAHAFAALGRSLQAVDAPRGLIDWCERARADEERHATLCLELANGRSSAPRELEAFDPPSPDTPADLGALGASSLVDGCYAEGIAAAVAADLARSCTDPRTRDVLEAIASDEADHAELAWAIVALALERGGPAVRRAIDDATVMILMKALEALPRQLGTTLVAPDGIPTDDALARAEVSVALALLDRLQPTAAA